MEPAKNSKTHVFITGQCGHSLRVLLLFDVIEFKAELAILDQPWCLSC